MARCGLGYAADNIDIRFIKVTSRTPSAVIKQNPARRHREPTWKSTRPDYNAELLQPNLRKPRKRKTKKPSIMQLVKDDEGAGD
jgi:hypothetical protein